MRYDVSVGSSGDKRLVDVQIGESAFIMDYDDAEMLRDMLTDGLDHIDQCEHQERMAVNPPQASAAWNLYLQNAFNRRAE